MIEHVIINQNKPEEDPFVEVGEWLFTTSSCGDETSATLVGKISLDAFAAIGKSIRETISSFSDDSGISKKIILGLFVRGLTDETDSIRIK